MTRALKIIAVFAVSILIALVGALFTGGF